MSVTVLLRRFTALAFLGALIAIPRAFAHEGHDHAAPEPVATDPSLVVRSASNDAYELVLKYRSVRGQKSTALRVYLADFATNAPIVGALLTLRTTTPRPVSATARQTSPGVYETSFEYGEAGRYVMIASVGGGSPAEFALQDLPMGEDLAAASTGATRPRSGGLNGWLIAVIVAAFLAAAALIVRRRWTRARTAVVLLVTMAALWRAQVYAHEGHQHADQPAGQAPAAAGQPRYMPKESQFFLGIRTVIGQLESLRARIDAVGHVEAESGTLARVEAPRDGRLEATGRPLKVGDRVRRGQVIANLLVIDALPIRAPLSGLVAEVHFTPGEWVQAGDPLAVILDERQVRVELPLFGENLNRALRTRSATVTTTALPGVQFPATVRGLAPTAPEPVGAAEGETQAGSPIPPLLLSVTNRDGLLRPGMLVEVSLELPNADELIAVPESAVIQQEGGSTVFVHSGPEVFEQRPVRIVGRYVNRVGIAGAIRAGERIVVEGAQSLVSAPPVTPAPTAAKATP